MSNQIIQGILLGGYYALIACGLSFMFSVMRIINLAHGSLAVLAAYALWWLASRFHISPFLGLLIVLPLMAAIGWALQRFLLERSARGGALLPILTTFGLAIVIDNLLFEQFGADTRSLAPYIGSLSYDSWEWPGSIYVGKLAVIIFVTAVVLLGGLQLFLTRTGLAARSAPPRKILIRPAWSASMRVAPMPSPRRSPWSRSALPAPFSACAPPSIPMPARRNCCSPSRRRSSAAPVRCGERWSAASCWRWRRHSAPKCIRKAF